MARIHLGYSYHTNEVVDPTVALLAWDEAHMKRTIHFRPAAPGDRQRESTASFIR